VVAEPELSFAGLLRQLRTRARLTQEELAEAAGLSPRSVSDLERGINRTARKDTAGLLADVLSLSGQVRALFIAAAGTASPRPTRRRRAPDQPEREQRPRSGPSPATSAASPGARPNWAGCWPR
jgi:transcriptional regulator with XRE-family HTH domain